MKNFSEHGDEEVAKATIFKNFKIYCDVGGGTVGIISRILEQHPGIQGTLLDLGKAILPNVTKIAGSFFEAVSCINKIKKHFPL